MGKSTYLPIGISLEKRNILLVGGGEVALRKVETLLEYNTDITVIAPEVHDKIRYYSEKGILKLEMRTYESPEASDFGIVISASDSSEVNETVYKDCSKAGIPVNVVDNPDLCDFIFPAVLKRNCISVSVSTDGQAPFLSGHLRLILENVFPETHWK